MPRTENSLAKLKRIRPEKPKTRYFKVKFNGETLHACCKLYDARGMYEKELNRKEGKLSGSVIIFFHGHGQRPTEAYNLLSEMALRSKSGIALVPVCDTPYGRDKMWRGDRGKMVILMEVIKYMLFESGIDVEGFFPLTDMPVIINGKEMTGRNKIDIFHKQLWKKIESHYKNLDSLPKNITHIITEINTDYWKLFPSTDSKKNKITASLLLTGWSHGGILSRRFANAYPGASTGLVQMCPCGFSKWVGKNFFGPLELLIRFTLEAINISRGIFSYPGDVISSGSGVLKGVIGDSIRSWASLIFGNKHPLKPFRNLRDIKDASIYANDGNYPVHHLKHQAVILAKGDSLFHPSKLIGTVKTEIPMQKDTNNFWQKYYPGALRSGTKLVLRVLPGDHIGPVTHYYRYAETALLATDQCRG